MCWRLPAPWSLPPSCCNERKTMTSPTPRRFRAALVQLRAGRSIAVKLDSAEALIRRAGRGGAAYVQTPENTALMELEAERILAQAQPEDESVPLARLRALARELGIWLHVGSLAIRLDPERVVSRSFLITPEGEIRKERLTTRSGSSLM